MLRNYIFNHRSYIVLVVIATTLFAQLISFAAIADAVASADPQYLDIIQNIKDTDNLPYIKSRMIILSQLIVDKKITVDESAKIVRNIPRFYNSLIDVRSYPNPYGSDEIDENLTKISIQWVNLLNDLHGMPNRFNSIKESNPRELYTLLVYSKKHIYASSFKGVFSRLMQRMTEENITGDELLSKLGYNRYDTFIDVLIYFNRLNIFLKTMKPEMQFVLLDKYVDDIKNDQDLIDRSVMLADAFKMIKNADVLDFLRNKFAEKYEKYEKNNYGKGKTAFGYLIGIYGRNMQELPYLFEISKKYPLSFISGISVKKLFNQQIVCVQQYFFYDDADGYMSFNYFNSQYKKKPGWSVSDHKTYTITRSPVIKGRVIEIYANKPGYSKSGSDDIKEYFKTKKIFPVVAVHRGHSYQTFRTLKNLSSQLLVMIWGSCEGYRESEKTYQKCPNLVLSVSTRGVTDAYINEIIGQTLNDELLYGSQGSFDISKYWNLVKQNKTLISDPDFIDYVDPAEGYGIRLKRSVVKADSKSSSVSLK